MTDVGLRTSVFGPPSSAKSKHLTAEVAEYAEKNENESLVIHKTKRLRSLDKINNTIAPGLRVDQNSEWLLGELGDRRSSFFTMNQKVGFLCDLGAVSAFSAVKGF